MKRIQLLVFMTLLPLLSFGQREASVHGKYVYVVSDNDHITLREAKRKCVEKAMAEAVKEKFGELVISDVVDSNVETNGSATASYFWENTAAMAKGEWLGETREPKIDVEYKDGNLVFSAEVWGIAREISQAKVDLDWSILKDYNGQKAVASAFENRESVYLRFRAPSDGFLAAYLTVGDGETFCLLPYPKDSDGRFFIKGGQDYMLFDKEIDPMAKQYRLTTTHPLEVNQMVVIFSPKPFTKCNDTTEDNKHPGSVSTREFQKWLLKCQRTDRDMVVDKKWVKIHNANVE